MPCTTVPVYIIQAFPLVRGLAQIVTATLLHVIQQGQPVCLRSAYVTNPNCSTCQLSQGGDAIRLSTCDAPC